MFSILHKDSPTFTSSPPKFHIYDNLCGYQPEYYKCKLSKGLAKCAAELVPGYRLMFSILRKDSPTFTSSPPKFHIYDNLCGYQPEYYKCKLSKGLAKCAAELVPILPKL